jgi:hypothetical protein
LRSKESPCIHETEYLNTAGRWAGDVDNPIYKYFQRTFRVSFELYKDIVEAAYDSGRFRCDGPGGKNTKRGAPPTHLTLSIMATLRVMPLGCPMDGMRLESGISQHVLAKFFQKFTRWMVEKYFVDNVHMPSDTVELESVET